MSLYTPEFSPIEARDYLVDFVEKAEHIGEVESYEQLSMLVDATVVGAMVDLIHQTGRPPKHPESRIVKVLDHKHGRRLMQGSISPAYNDDDFRLELRGLHRNLFGFKTKELVMMSSGGINSSSIAFDKDEMFTPYTASSDSIGFYKDEVGPQSVYTENRVATGLEIAGSAIRSSPQMLNGFLRVTAQLTKELVSVGDIK